MTARKDPPARANVGFDFQLLRPGAEAHPDQTRPAIRASVPVPPDTARRKVNRRLAVSKIQSAATGDEKFRPAEGWLSQTRTRAPASVSDLRRPETGRASADLLPGSLHPASAHKFFSCR